MLDHSHTPAECGAVFAAFRAFDSPLRHKPTLASCHYGGHRIWWQVDAATEGDALGQLPHYVAERTTAIRVRSTELP